MNKDLLALEKFLLDNPELDRLESLLDDFNIFEKNPNDQFDIE
jgi:hypothetical protein